MLESIKEEVSHVADEAYSEDGTPLYDSVMVTSRDKSKLEGFIDDAIRLFVRKEFDICKYNNIDRLEFHVPDFDDTMTAAVNSELNRYIVMYACTSLFQQRRVAVVQEYSVRAQSAMDKAVSLLKSRKHPVTTW